MNHKDVYKTRAWRRVRDAYIAQRIAVDGGICEVCGVRPGKVVHHKIWLTDSNCNDPMITFNSSNLRYECQTCHNKEKDPAKRLNDRYKFGSNGEILPI